MMCFTCGQEEEMSETAILERQGFRYAYRRRGDEDAPAVVLLMGHLGRYLAAMFSRQLLKR